MKSSDMRFNESTIQSWIGKEFKHYKCDPFDYTNSVTQIVGLYIDDNVYKLSNTQNRVDYYGNEEEIAIFSLKKVTAEGLIQSAFKDTSQIITPVDGIITKVQLINENQRILAS